jgi:Hemerythrin HHE cation binding domain
VSSPIAHPAGTENPYNADGALTDTSDMGLPHAVFRHEFGLAPGIVRRAPEGDTERAGTLSVHLTFLVDSLTHHHETEDELLWPLLLDRVPEGVAPMVTLMEIQHHELHGLLEKARAQSAAWANDPTAANREALARTLDDVGKALDEHLLAEETHMLPLAATTVSQEEWQRLGAAGTAAIPRDKRMLALGTMRYVAPPELVARIEADIPRLLRPLVTRSADRTFRRTALQIHGTPTP